MQKRYIKSPPSIGASQPLLEEAPFSNTSTSAKTTDGSYLSGTPLPNAALDGNIDPRYQYIKNQQEYPR